MKKAREDARAAIAKWDESIRERDLREKRRVAPGWLDREEKLLQPTMASTSGGTTGVPASSLLDGEQERAGQVPIPSLVPRDEGEELDRAFGGLNVK